MATIATALRTRRPDEPRGLWERMRSAATGCSIQEVARRTGANPETTRRYLRGGTPTIWFVIEFCRAFNVSADWLLVGVGPRRGPA